MNIYEQLTYINKTSLALGFFDGLHLGHKVVLKNTIKIAKKNDTTSTVITFKSHPLNYLTDENVEQILTTEEKLNMLESYGIDNVVILDFQNIANIKAEEYISDVLVKYFSPIAITTGFNHSFGYKGKGNSDLLKEYSKKFDYNYYEIPPCVLNGDVISCSVIRNKLQLGNFFDANQLLGYKFYITEKVIEGDKIAASLGFPSANINWPKEKIKIPYGVYFVQVFVDGKIYNAVLNHAPDKSGKIKTEAHIIGFNGNIYGENITILFVSKIRNQMDFENVDKLKAQIIRDIAFTDIYQHYISKN